MKLNGIIYFLRCSVTNRIYVGSTSKSMKHRWQQHLNALASNRHENSKLQNTYNKYGAISYQIVEETLLQNLLNREQH
jgi:hypothetical protein